MTAARRVSSWIRGRSPGPPSALVARIDEMVGRYATDGECADALLGVAESAMRVVLVDGCLTRASALDLLAVDAIITYAFEAAADDPPQLDERTAAALRRIAALAASHEA